MNAGEIVILVFIIVLSIVNIGLCFILVRNLRACTGKQTESRQQQQQQSHDEEHSSENEFFDVEWNYHHSHHHNNNNTEETNGIHPCLLSSNAMTVVSVQPYSLDYWRDDDDSPLLDYSKREKTIAHTKNNNNSNNIHSTHIIVDVCTTEKKNNNISNKLEEKQVGGENDLVHSEQTILLPIEALSEELDSTISTKTFTTDLLGLSSGQQPDVSTVLQMENDAAAKREAKMRLVSAATETRVTRSRNMMRRGVPQTDYSANEAPKIINLTNHEKPANTNSNIHHAPASTLIRSEVKDNNTTTKEEPVAPRPLLSLDPIPKHIKAATHQEQQQQQVSISPTREKMLFFENLIDQSPDSSRPKPSRSISLRNSPTVATHSPESPSNRRRSFRVQYTDQEMRQSENKLIEWIRQAVPEVHYNSDLTLYKNLASGVVLCQLVGKQWPQHINMKKMQNKVKSPFQAAVNIQLFLDACMKIGIPRQALFSTEDLIQERNRVIIIGCLEQLQEMSKLNL